MIDNYMEYIICSAIYYNDKIEYIYQPINILEGFVVCGRRHHNIITTSKVIGVVERLQTNHAEIQGFLTSRDRFVDRHEGGLIAFKSGQTKHLKKELCSEDLY